MFFHVLRVTCVLQQFRFPSKLLDYLRGHCWGWRRSVLISKIKVDVLCDCYLPVITSYLYSLLPDNKSKSGGFIVYIRLCFFYFSQIACSMTITQLSSRMVGILTIIKLFLGLFLIVLFSDWSLCSLPRLAAHVLQPCRTTAKQSSHIALRFPP
jgi:hypothetical protein